MLRKNSNGGVYQVLGQSAGAHVDAEEYPDRASEEVADSDATKARYQVIEDFPVRDHPGKYPEHFERRRNDLGDEDPAARQPPDQDQ